MPDARPMYECTTCTSTYTSHWAAAYCCDPDTDLPSLVRSYD